MFNSVNTLKRGLDASYLRQQVISNNIANVDTVGFKASRVVFEDHLARAAELVKDDRLEMAATHEKHIVPDEKKPFVEVEPQIVTDETTSTRLDGNNVDIEREMVELAKNSINYYATVSKINSEFRKLGKVISG
jgi:flagellar basal-body rod protein FlgB